jgi:hypothetical protein
MIMDVYLHLFWFHDILMSLMLIVFKVKYEYEQTME